MFKSRQDIHLFCQLFFQLWVMGGLGPITDVKGQAVALLQGTHSMTDNNSCSHSNLSPVNLNSTPACGFEPETC